MTQLDYLYDDEKSVKIRITRTFWGNLSVNRVFPGLPFGGHCLKRLGPEHPDGRVLLIMLNIIEIYLCYNFEVFQMISWYDIDSMQQSYVCG